MNPTRKKIALLVGAAALGLWTGSHRPENVSVRLSPSRPLVEAQTSATLETASAESSAKAPVISSRPTAAPATRQAMAALVTARYRQEQLTRELDLEQRRYGRNYWDAECDGRALGALQQAREAMLRELSADANEVLNALFPDEAGEPIALTAFFGVDRAGPNVTFLSASSRERFEAALLAAPGETVADAGRLTELAAQVLSPNEIDLYRQWNEPAAAALRNQLVGFAPTEAEFVAILRDAQSVANEEPASTGIAGLETQLGAARFGELLKVRDPATQTALHDLYRLGLPLDNAGWLAAAREQAIASIQEVWQSAAVPDATKSQQVAQLERAHAQAINAKLNLSGSSLDELESNP